jgi:hypothetical protein
MDKCPICGYVEPNNAKPVSNVMNHYVELISLATHVINSAEQTIVRAADPEKGIRETIFVKASQLEDWVKANLAKVAAFNPALAAKYNNASTTKIPPTDPVPPVKPISPAPVVNIDIPKTPIIENKTPSTGTDSTALEQVQHDAFGNVIPVIRS